MFISDTFKELNWLKRLNFFQLSSQNQPHHPTPQYMAYSQ